LRKVQELIDDFIRRKIIIGPDHFVLGDGFGNPGMHASLFVEPDRFYEATDLHEECVRRIAEKLAGESFDLVIVPDDQSLFSAKILARVLAGEYKVPFVPVHSMEWGDPPPQAGRILIHDDVVNRGRQAREILDRLAGESPKPIAISSLFTRSTEPELFGLPVFSAVDRMLAATPEDDCPLCREGVPVNPLYGKGALFLALRGESPLPYIVRS